MESEHLTQELSDQDRLLIVFGYLGPLAFVSLVAGRREFVKWHAKQGLVLSAALGVLYLILRFVHFIVDTYLLAFLGELFWTTAWMVMLGVCLIVGLIFGNPPGPHRTVRKRILEVCAKFADYSYCVDFIACAGAMWRPEAREMHRELG